MVGNGGDKRPSKLTLRLFGLTDEFISLIPDGKKSTLLNQLVTEAVLSDKILTSLIIVFGQKEGNRLYKKARKLTNGINLSSDERLIVGQNSSVDGEIVEEDAAVTVSQSKKNTSNDFNSTPTYNNDDPLASFSIENKAQTDHGAKEIQEDEISEKIKIEFDFDK